MDYATGTDFRGDTAAALGVAVGALTAAGYRMTSKDASSAEFSAPSRWAVPKGSPLAGASVVRVRVGGGRIELEADLGGVRRRRLWAIAAVALVAIVELSVAAGFWHSGRPGHRSQFPWPVLVAPAVLMVVFPIASAAQARRCRSTLDGIVANMAMAGR